MRRVLFQTVKLNFLLKINVGLYATPKLGEVCAEMFKAHEKVGRGQAGLNGQSQRFHNLMT